MRVLGISSYYHDSAATLIEDGQVVAAIQEERLSRVKQDSRFPVQSIQFCLAHGKITLSEMDAVVFYEKPFLKFDRLLETYLHQAPKGFRFFKESFSSLIQKNLFARSELTKQLRYIDSKFDAQKLFFSEHHLSHAASAFFPSPFEQATVLTLDGVGEWATSSVGVGKENHLQLHQESHFPHSLGFFYSMLTAFCGFKVNSGEYKLMGLAPYGSPVYVEEILKEIVSLTEDGATQLNLKYFDFLSGKRMYSKEVQNLFQIPPRDFEAPLSQKYFDIAASTQKALETILLEMTQKIYEKFPSENLCMAGGVALNCVANSRLLERGPFKNIWIQPAAGDAGGSLGAALAFYHLHCQKNRVIKPEDAMKASLLGPEFSPDSIQAALDKAQLIYQSDDLEKIHQITAQELNQGKSVGWFQGRSEFGPRALGNRSILADARHPEMQKKLNLQIKFRESFRPFAPLVLAEEAAEWFDLSIESPYMLFVAKPKGPIPLPAVTHVDGSARLQTVSNEQNPMIYRLLKEFKKQTSCPVLVNTSFNIRGEPIVNTPEEAIRCFLGTDLDVLVMGRFIVYKENNMNLVLNYRSEVTPD